MHNTKIVVPIVILSMAAGFFGGLVSVKYVYVPQGSNGVGGNEIIRTVEESDITKAIERVSPSVVSIVALKDVPVNYYYRTDKNVTNPFVSPFFNNPLETQLPNVEYKYEEVSGGTGFIVQADGLVLTNRHVVQDEEADYKIVLSDGSEYEAEVKSRDPFDDVAILQIVMKDAGKADFPFVEFDDSDSLKIGQRVVAIGNALAQYNNTATEGIISAKGRDVAAYDEGAGLTRNLSGLLQTDAAINFGNSGGPLVDMDGKVIGMNSAVANSANGIGFAIPSNDIAPILKSFQENGEIVHPVLGVRFLMLTEAEAQEIDKSLKSGALLVADELNGVDSVIKDGAADNAGLQGLDVILAVDGEEINLDNPLHKVIRKYAPGDKITLRVWREGKEIEVNVTLMSSKDLEAELAE